jgi:hypothetical protein
MSKSDLQKLYDRIASVYSKVLSTQICLGACVKHSQANIQIWVHIFTKPMGTPSFC